MQDVFSYWSNFKNFPRIMSNVEEVRMMGQDTSHWKVKGPLGTSVDFDAKTTEMDPGRGIGWNTVEGQVHTSGEVRFEEVAPGRTRIDVTMNYADPLGGKIGEVAANVLSNPEREMREDTSLTSRRWSRGASWAGRGARRRAGSLASGLR